MRILFTADWHVTETFSPVIQKSQQRAVDEIIRLYFDQSCSLLCIAGDLTHDKSYVYHSSLRRLESVLSEHPEMQVCVVVGNHDYVQLPKNHGLSLLDRSFDNISVIDELHVEKIDGLNYAFLPHSPDIVDQLAELEDIQVLVSHFGIADAQVMPGLSLGHRITMDLLSKFQHVFLGHYHLPQLLQRPGTDVYYVGSHAAMSWHEKNQEKRVIVFDTESAEAISYELQTPSKFIEFVANTEDELHDFQQQKTALKDNGHFVRIRSHVPVEAESSDNDILLDLPVDDTELQTLQEADPIELLKQWITKFGDLPSDVSVDSTVADGKKLLEAAQSQLTADE